MHVLTELLRAAADLPDFMDADFSVSPDFETIFLIASRISMIPLSFRLSTFDFLFPTFDFPTFRPPEMDAAENGRTDEPGNAPAIPPGFGSWLRARFRRAQAEPLDVPAAPI